MTKLQRLKKCTSRVAVRLATSIGLVVLLACCSCSVPKACCNPHFVRNEIAQRTGQRVETAAPCEEVIPDSVNLDDGLSEFEAVTIGLANNSAFSSDFGTIGDGRRRCVASESIGNPQVVLYFPAGAKEGQATLYAPIES